MERQQLDEITLRIDIIKRRSPEMPLVNHKAFCLSRCASCCLTSCAAQPRGTNSFLLICRVPEFGRFLWDCDREHSWMCTVRETYLDLSLNDSKLANHLSHKGCSYVFYYSTFFKITFYNVWRFWHLNSWSWSWKFAPRMGKKVKISLKWMRSCLQTHNQTVACAVVCSSGLGWQSDCHGDPLEAWQCGAAL